MASKKLSIVLELVDGATKQLEKVGRSFDNLSSKMNKAVGASKAFAVGMTAVAGGVVAGAIKSIGLAREQIRVEKQLEQVITSTGGSAGLTAEEIKKMANSLQKVSNYGDEAIISGQNMLLTFTNIGRDVFPNATQTMLDMSTAMGTGLKDTAIQLGKALNDPVKGISALSRVGVNFTDQQKEVIQAMIDTGDVAGAQTVILDELAKEFGGSAKAQVDPIIQLKNVLSDMAEEVGILLLDKINPLVVGLLNWIDKMGGLQGIVENATSWLESHKAIIFIVAGAILGALVPALFAGATAGWAFISPLIPFIAIGALVASAIYVIWQGFKSLKELLPTLTEAWRNMKDKIIELSENIRSKISDFWNGLKNSFNTGTAFLRETWDSIMAFLRDNLGSTMDIMFTIATGGMWIIYTWFVNNKEKIAGGINQVWQSVKDKALSAFNGIKQGIRSAIQFVLSKINKLIMGVNRITGAVGIKIALPTIPAFADGGIVTRPTIGLIGEAGTEAIVPLNKANKFGFGGGGSTININWSGAVDERSAEMVAMEVARVLDNNGRNSIAMGTA